MQETNSQPAELLDFTTEIVAAYVSNNAVNSADLAGLIASTHSALRSLALPPAPPEAEPLVPAVPIKRSVTPDYIICLEDGKKFKSLKRHLATHFQLTPDAYRTKWGLPSDYPMVAPNYTATRSALAKSSGLGRKPATTTPAKRVRTATKP